MGQDQFLLHLQVLPFPAVDLICVGSIQVHIPDRTSPHRLILRVHLPDAYPSGAAPILELNGGCAPEHERQAAAQQLEKMFEPGEVSVMHQLTSFSPHLAHSMCHVKLVATSI